MLRNLAFAVGCAVSLIVLCTAASFAAADFGTPEEAKAMLEKAVAAVKQDKAKALDAFNAGEAGFKDRDLYVWCANASDGIMTAHPYGQKGKQLRDIKGYHGAPFGETIMQDATEGAIKQTTYWWPRPGTDQPLEKTAFYTKVVTRFVVSASAQRYVRFDPKRTSSAVAPLATRFNTSQRLFKQLDADDWRHTSRQLV
jgi:hypothetical protein